MVHRPPFPPFNLDIVDEQGVPYEKADEWEIDIHLLDGYGRYCDDKLGQNERARRVVTRKGSSTVAGLRFYAVSSKNGGFFHLEFEIRSPRDASASIPPIRSGKITILSCRLFHNPKAPLDKLRPEHGLSMMPGIGRLYAQRFTAIGVYTIGKMAAIDLDGMTAGQARQFLDSLRKDKGTMTRAKLEDYISQAREVVRRVSAGSPDMPPAKRVKTGCVELVCGTPMAVPEIAADQAVSDGVVEIPTRAWEKVSEPVKTWPIQTLTLPQAARASARRDSTASIRTEDLGFHDIDVESLDADAFKGRRRSRRGSSVSKYLDASLLGALGADVEVKCVGRTRRSASIVEVGLPFTSA